MIPINDQMEPTSEFESHRRFLRGLAYRMLGSVAEAEDAVQDCWLRWRDVPHADIIEPRAFLAQILTRLCFDRLRCAQKQREHYVGVWLPEPLIDDPDTAHPGADEMVAMAQDLQIAFLLVLQKLTPSERAVFLLNEVFDWDFDAIAQVLDRSSAACRQLATRARQRMAASEPKPDARHKDPTRPAQATPRAGTTTRRGTSLPSPEHAKRIASAFAMALQMGDVQALADTLAQDVVFMSDGGGKAPSVPMPLVGADKVAQVLRGFARLWLREPGTIRQAFINGMPGAVFHSADGTVVQTLALEIAPEARITAVYVMRNPDKLKHLPGA